MGEGAGYGGMKSPKLRPLVREMKIYNHIQVANAMYACGYFWKNSRRSTNIERMVQGLPRCELERILSKLT